MSSSWRSYLDPGHLSPYFRISPTAAAPTVTNDDYQYLGPDDIVDPPRPRPSYNPSDSNYFHGSGSRADADNPDSPDILVCRHKNTTYPLHFPAFCIGEGVLRVSELRKRVAKELRARSSRHVKLYYKAKELKDDAVACREEGLKQNSEIMCVVSETAVQSGSTANDSSESADEEDILRAEREQSDRAADGQPGKKRKGHRGGKKGKKGNGTGDNYSTSDTNTNTNTPRSNTPQPRTASTSAPSMPTTPMEKLNVLAAQFRDQWEPQCTKLMQRPPAEPKTRESEYKKLSEMLLTQILIKADAVQSEGNDEARAKRKVVVKEAQAMLNEMDAWMKKWDGRGGR